MASSSYSDSSSYASSSSSSEDERNVVDKLLDEGINVHILNHCVHTEWNNRNDVLLQYPQVEVDKFTRQFAVQKGVKSATLGSLERLPLEIKSLVAVNMDLVSLVRFMHTNRSAWALVQQLPEFRLVTEFAGTSAFLGALVTGVSHFVTLPQIQAALTTYQCTTCPNFGELVFLPTMERCCGDCLRECGNFEVRDISLISRPPGINPRKPVLTGDPAVFVQPSATGIQTQLPLMWAYRGPGVKYDMHMLRIFPSSMQRSVLGRELVREIGAHKVYKRDSWTVCRVPRIENPWGLHERHQDRHSHPEWIPGLLAAIPVPYLKDRRTGALVREGVRCAGGCKEKRILMPTTYLEEHFLQCRGAKKLFLEYRDKRGLDDGGVVIDGEYSSSSDGSEDEEEGEEEEDEENGEEDEDEESGEGSEEHSDSEWDEGDEEMGP